MENKPLKRNKHIVSLSKDHHTTLLFCWKIRNGLKFNVEPARMVEYVLYFWQHHMQPHFRQEEEILFAPISNESVARAIDDHGQIKARIESIETPEHLATLADLVDNHVRYEERILFPLLEKELTEAQLEDIGDRLAQAHTSTPKDDFTDQFWIR